MYVCVLPGWWWHVSLSSHIVTVITGDAIMPCCLTWLDNDLMTSWWHCLHRRCHQYRPGRLTSCLPLASAYPSQSHSSRFVFFIFSLSCRFVYLRDSQIPPSFTKYFHILVFFLLVSSCVPCIPVFSALFQSFHIYFTLHFRLPSTAPAIPPPHHLSYPLPFHSLLFLLLLLFPLSFSPFIARSSGAPLRPFCCSWQFSTPFFFFFCTFCEAQNEETLPLWQEIKLRAGTGILSVCRLFEFSHGTFWPVGPI